MNMPNFASRYQAVRSSTVPAAKLSRRIQGRQEESPATLMKSRRLGVVSPRICAPECTPQRLVEMKDLIHARPPLAILAIWQRLLHRPCDCPPFLSLRI